MDFSQRKLSKSEWDGIEVPVKPAELRILQLIQGGYHDVQTKRNNTPTLLHYMKITNSPPIDLYIYVNYFQEQITTLVKKYAVPMVYTPSVCESSSLKKADYIRLTNTEKQMQSQSGIIFEFVLLMLLKTMLQLKKTPVKGKGGYPDNQWLINYYTLRSLLSYTIPMNDKLRTVLNALLSIYEPEVHMLTLLSMGHQLIEKNDYLLKYADECLYEHQKQLFSLCKRPAAKLILYIAPTGTGKTLSPIGLSEKHKVIFVCAARHVGLALARSAISIQKRVAFAYGCNDAEDIRLHYYAAKEFTRNKKSGGIGKVDNTQGEKVEIIVSDIQSYLPAMYYMLAFNPKENIIVYWDEPTISLDYETHEFHAIIQKNWCENIIPNVVLSSATLPQQAELRDTVADFCGRFAGAEVHEIVSHDCKKTIPLLNKDNFVEMPHFLTADYTQVQAIVKHCQSYKTLLRYLDLQETINFITHVHQEPGRYVLADRYALHRHFPTLDTINMAAIKTYYLTLLGNLHPLDWPKIYSVLLAQRTPLYKSTIHLTTTDAYTITDGPAIYLADDVNKVAQFYMQSAAIPAQVTQDIMRTIQFNSDLNMKIALLERELQDAGGVKDEDAEKTKQKRKNEKAIVDPEMRRITQEIQTTLSLVKSITLDPQYVPNTNDHVYKIHRGEKPRVFTCEISENTVEQIMLIDDIEDSWKLLLVMGIGVFAATNKSVRYTEIMKELAAEQKLFCIIAATDYIYGTNYQFCHGYIGKDLAQMSQEKCIQAMGRVGRNGIQQTYSIRFRDNDLLRRLFVNDADKPEVRNMNRLFATAD
jgi:hypothetical protein